MNTLKNIIYAILFAFVFISCEKEESEPKKDNQNQNSQDTTDNDGSNDGDTVNLIKAKDTSITIPAVYETDTTVSINTEDLIDTTDYDLTSIDSVSKGSVSKNNKTVEYTAQIAENGDDCYEVSFNYTVNDSINGKITVIVGNEKQWETWNVIKDYIGVEMENDNDPNHILTLNSNNSSVESGTTQPLIFKDNGKTVNWKILKNGEIKFKSGNNEKIYPINTYSNNNGFKFTQDYEFIPVDTQ